jgi:capsular polysaccharide transport system permease protein
MDKPPTRFLDPLDRARQVSQALSEAARFARFSTRSRPSYLGGGFQARRGAAFLRLAMQLSFAVVVVLPSLVSYTYYGLFASNQYVAEARFLVHTSIIPQLDNIGALTGLQPMAIVQDTQIVMNYIGSRAAVDALSGTIDVRQAYSDPEIDTFSRFGKDRPIEQFVRYWQQMVTTAVALPSGIVSLKVKAFRPEQALQIANAIIQISEDLVNDMNTRMNRDALNASEVELQRATQRLTRARLALEKARNDDGFLDASKAGDAISSLVLESKSSLLAMQQEYMTKGKMIGANTPQMKVLKDRIDATTKQISDMEAQLTATRTDIDKKLTVSSSLSRFAELDLERQIAERLYSGAVASLEVAKVASEQKMIYLNTFLLPSLPQEAEYPKRFLYPSLTALIVLAIWGAAWGLITLVRNHMA